MLKRLIAISVILGFFVFEAYVILVQREGDSPLPPLFGNFEHVRLNLVQAPKKKEFSFAIVGDIKSVGTFERIAEELQKTQIDFLVLLGDCTYDGSEAAHRFFHAEVTEEYRFPFPVFYVVGNHDVSSKRFSISRFEETYGPSIFSFEYQGCLFIVLRIMDKPFLNEESIAFLEKILTQHPEKYRKRFAFMHIPPEIPGYYKARKFDSSERVVSLLDKLRIDYAFAGDFHGYARTTIGHTTYIISGGGGSRLSKKYSPQFHHAIMITVSEGSVSERIIPASTSYDIEDLLEKLAFVTIYPWMSAHPFVAGILNICVLLIFIYLVHPFLKKWLEGKIC